MSGQGDDRAQRALEQALAAGPLDVLALLDAVRGPLGETLAGHEGAVHALLQREIERGRILVGGLSRRGLALYHRPATPAPADAEEIPTPEPLDADTARRALRIASALRDPATRGRVQADVLAHLADLASRGRSQAFGSARTARQLLHRVARGRPAVCLAASAADGLWRFLLHEGPWLLGAVLIFFALKLFVLQVYVIPSRSMVPALLEGDRVVVFYGHGDDLPPRWSIVTFEIGDTTYVKRLVGLPGESIAILHGDVFVDGRLLVKPDDLRAAMRHRVATWDFGGTAPPSGWQASTDAQGVRTWRWQRDAFPAHPPGFGGQKFALRDGYLELWADRAARSEVRLVLARGPGPGSDGRVTRFELVLGIQGLQLREARATVGDDGRERAAGREVLAEDTGAPPTGRVALRLSYVDGILRASCGGWSWQGARDAPDGALMPAIHLAGEGGAIRSLTLDGDQHYAHLGQNGVPIARDPHRPNPHPIPAGHVFVLGDNTTNSEDSRYRAKGTIPVHSLVGPVRFRIWPPARIGTVR